jgi:hypothetical protein
MKVVYDKEGNRFIQCDCGRVSMALKWDVSDKMLELILNKYAMCPQCRDNADDVTVAGNEAEDE